MQKVLSHPIPITWKPSSSWLQNSLKLHISTALFPRPINYWGKQNEIEILVAIGNICNSIMITYNLSVYVFVFIFKHNLTLGQQGDQTNQS